MRIFKISAFIVVRKLRAQVDYKAPCPGGKHPSDLNTWYLALNTANYDIEMHIASHSLKPEGPHGVLCPQ